MGTNIKKKDLLKLKRRIRAAKRRIEFKRLCNEYSHCYTCGVDMSLMVCEIDFGEVRGNPELFDLCDSCCCGESNSEHVDLTIFCGLTLSRCFRFLWKSQIVPRAKPLLKVLRREFVQLLLFVF